MGVDAGDFDNDGDEDLFVTNLTGEGNDLYVNDGSGLFEEQSARSGLGGAKPWIHGIWNRLVRHRQRRLARHPHRQRRCADDRGAQTRQRSVSAAPAKAVVPAISGHGTIRGRHRARRRGVRVVGSRAWRRVRRHRQRRRRGRAGRQQQRPAAAARQQHRQPESLDRAAARGRRTGSDHKPGSRHARRARRHRARRWLHALAPCSIGWQLCVGERSASAGGSRPVNKRFASSSDLAEWPTEEWSSIAVDRYTTLREGEGK